MSSMQGRVLLAVSAQTRERLLSCFPGCAIVWAQTAEEVRAAAGRESFDMVVVGSHFDESHTFDILALIREAHPAPRIVCVRGRPFPGALGRSTMQAFRAACEALGVDMVVDLLDYTDDEAGNLAIRTLFARRMITEA